MILVDSSAGIAHLKGRETTATTRLRALASNQPLLVGDLILLEIQKRTHNDADATRIERGLRRYTIVPLLDDELASRAARNYRRLRSIGITLRKTADLVIGTYCIERGCALLHEDRDFDAMEKHLGLIVD